MTRVRDEAAGDHAVGASALLAFAVAGVLPEGDAAPRLGYRRAGDGYDEARAATGRVIAIGDGVTLEFSLPADRVDFILIEPAAVPGSYRIARMACAGEGVADLHRRVIAVDGHMEAGIEDGSVCFGNGRRRPAIELDVRGLTTGAAGYRIDLVLLRDADGVATMDAIAHLARGVFADRDLDRAGMTRLGREVASASDRIGDIVEAVSGLPAMAAGQARLDERIEGLAVAGDALARRVEMIEVAVADQSLAGLAALVERSASERAAAEAAAALDREASARDLRGVLQALVELRAQVDHVTHSVENVFWRRWLRRLRGGAR